jgi:hypothetical protein
LARGQADPMEDKTDYSPVVEEAGEAEKRRERRKWSALLGGAHAFWLYALLLAGIILLFIYLTGGFGSGAD